MEFHIARQTRDRYQFDDALFSLTGNVIFANFHAARVFAQKMNQKRDLVNFPEQAVRAGQINAMGLIDEILHQIAAQYREQRNPLVMAQALDWLEGKLGHAALDLALKTFVDTFPTVAVYRQNQDVDAYLQGQTEGISNRQVVLEEMILLWLANMNPAFSPFMELYDDTRLEEDSHYPQVITELHAFFDSQPRFGPNNQNLIDMLRAPALAHPHSLEDQLHFISTHWTSVLGQYLYRLLTSLDFIKEENKATFFGPGPTQVPTYSPEALAAMGVDMSTSEIEHYSPDRDWMPRVVLIAKNTYVWLDQLSRKYQRAITRLDQIPDEELDMLARWGFTGLWLIGLWQRSPASQHIKQLTGTPDALPSAYSLFDYHIADDLGGEAACQNLRERALRRGIRMASDMVPNHMGIDSPWVVEHPDWFVQLEYSPYPSYTYNGPDLSNDGRVGIFIEDHYYDRTDAAVVFKRRDRSSGQERFVYHGNDGTSMPWNDTAQLNYLLPQVREAVIQTILHVARQFPIIRFDAAMTLAKRHYQRLWYPEPGGGGAIPSRAEHGLTREQFNAQMPVEFWREVVDRAASEAPDTLLLAEAFWMMEGYFVRTLGMHRVYNSAFMNMLRDEENAKYRALIKNTLEFDPQILKRYVNFMNNPDERTAIDQFGKGDKYFGICTVMSTLPGLPMFGHGQVEGFAEKYGMEFRRARWDEQPDTYLIERHAREIAPLLHMRYLFAGVEHFWLYDFFTPEGNVNEEVYAYSNCYTPPGSERAERGLIVYHNKFADTRGWIRLSAATLVKSPDGSQRLEQKTLGEGLMLSNAESLFTLFRDQSTGLEYIRSNRELHEKGLYLELNAYQQHVFLDFRELPDPQGHYARLAAYLNGNGVPSINEALDQLLLQPIQQPFREIVSADHLRWLLAEPADKERLQVTEQQLRKLLRAAQDLSGGAADVEPVIQALVARFAQVLAPVHEESSVAASAPEIAPPRSAGAPVTPAAPEDTATRATRIIWLCVSELGKVWGEEGFEQRSRSWIDEWQLGKAITEALHGLGLDDQQAAHILALIKLLTMHGHWYTLLGADEPPHSQTRRVLTTLLADPDVQTYLHVNRYRDVLWFNKECFDQLLNWLVWLAELQPADTLPPYSSTHIVDALRRAEALSEYQVEKLLAALPTP
ncbi:MAG TPA: alpha-amylase family glycosyl hydrolase [Anaerolineae bacterium]